MMTARAARLMLLLCMLASASAPAQAASIWGWLDELSGPGPFTPTGPGSLTIPIPGIAVSKRGGPMVLADNFDERRMYATFELTFWDNEPSDNFPRDVGITSYQFVAFVPFSAFGSCPVARDEPCSRSPLSAIDAGIGLGLYNFHGDGVARRGESFTRLSVPLRLKITPSELAVRKLAGNPRLRRVLSAFSYRIGVDSLPGSFDRRDFIGRANYKSKNNWLFNYALQIDLLQVLPIR